MCQNHTATSSPPSSRLAPFVRVVFLALGISLIPATRAFADGNPDIVGVLSELTDPNTAADLGLTEDQIDRMREMVKQHESKLLEIAAELRTLEPSARRDRSKQILRELENQAMGLLDATQRAKAEQLRLRQLGLLALLEPEIAMLMLVTDAQLAKLQTVIESRRGLLREFGAEKGEQEWRRQLEQILDESQKAQWNEMTGQTGSPKASSEIAGDDASQLEIAGSPSDRPVPAAGSVAGAAGAPNDGLRLNFNSVPWSDVLKWLAKEAELSLQTDFYPPGTFTYRDPYRSYTVAQAMDIMNSVLLSRGYTLVRRQRALMCIDLGSGENAEITRGLIRELAELVPLEQLDQRGEYEMCKSVFTLERLSVEDAEKEVQQLLGPQGSIVPLASANQLLVTETGGKLRIIRDTIRRSEMPDSGRTAKIVAVALQNMSAEEVLGIARPLLGLKEGANTSDELSISTDTFGTTLYATGTADKLQKLRDLITQVDVAQSDTSTSATSAEQLIVRSHTVQGSDPQTTMDVLQTQFAGQSNMNLALDPKSNNIIARATPTDHNIIDEIISSLAGESSDFQVIELNNLDTQAAILTLEKFFGKQSTKDSKDATAAKGPIFYGDTLTRRIMIKGTKQEVEQVRELLTKVQDTGPSFEGLRNNARFLPYSGKSADRILDQIDLLWEATKQKGRIRQIQPKEVPARNNKQEPKSPSASVRDASGRTPVAIDTARRSDSMAVRFTKAEMEVDPQDPIDATKPTQTPVEEATNSEESEVKIYRGPTGLIVTSDDPKLLSEFDEISRVVQEQMSAGPSEPTVIYLKYISAVAADELVRGVLSGSSASSGGGGSGLIGEMASSVLGGGGFLGSLLGMGGGGGSSASSSSMTASGEVFITADPRLNALWVQANPFDMQMIEQLVEIIDTPESPVNVQTRGTPHIIYLETAPVDQVEATVKSVFADRLASNASAASQRPPSPQEFIEALRGGGGGGGGRGRNAAPKELKEQTMSITADKKNNALIIMASQQLFEEVEALVMQLDKSAEGAEESVMVIPLGGDVNATTIQSALSSVFGSQAKTTSSTSGAQPSGQPAPQANNFNPQQLRGFNPAALGGGRGGNPFGGGANPFGGLGGGRGGNPFGGGGGGGNQTRGTNRGGRGNGGN